MITIPITTHTKKKKKSVLTERKVVTVVEFVKASVPLGIKNWSSV